jgi:hypothetical protein
MEVTMQIAFGTILLLLTVALTDPVKADPYPWCAEYTGGGLGGSSNCYFMTIEQCRATVAGVGGYCAPNPFYTGPTLNQQGQNPVSRRRPQPRYY